MMTGVWLKFVLCIPSTDSTDNVEVKQNVQITVDWTTVRTCVSGQVSQRTQQLFTNNKNSNSRRIRKAVKVTKSKQIISAKLSCNSHKWKLYKLRNIVIYHYVIQPALRIIAIPYETGVVGGCLRLLRLLGIQWLWIICLRSGAVSHCQGRLACCILLFNSRNMCNCKSGRSSRQLHFFVCTEERPTGDFVCMLVESCLFCFWCCSSVKL